MHLETTYLIELAEIFLFASIAGLILSKFKQPAIVAYILTGVFLGPSLLGLVKNQDLISQLSEIGVIALLFTLGLEFSFDKFKQVRKKAVFIGVFQILLTMLIVVFISLTFDFNIVQAVFLGSIVAMSSTVIVMKSLTDNVQLDSLHGKIMLGILIVQDLSLIPIMIILPKMVVGSGDIFMPLFAGVLKAVFFLLMILILSLKVAPVVMNYITSTNKEMLILSSITIAIGTAIAGTYFGISLALGAFVAGLALSITAHSKQVIAEVIPFRDVFAMVFFVSIGLLMDLEYFFSHWELIFSVVAGIILLKFFIIFALVLFAKYPGQTALWSALGLFQIGEFSFVLAKVGAVSNIIDNDTYSLVIISALFTMLITPFMMNIAPKIVFKMQDYTFWNKYFKGKVTVSSKEDELKDHVIICGFGPIGSSVAKILKIHGEKFIVVELNSKTIQSLKKEKTSAIYGDATNTDILKHAGIEKAKIMVIALPDVKSCEMTTLSARKLNEDLFIFVRARYQADIDKLYIAGANVVVYEEYETSMAIIDNVLSKLGYTCSEVEAVSGLIRANKCQLLKEDYRNRGYTYGRMSIFSDNEVEWVKVPERSLYSGKTLADCNIRSKTGASIITVIKGERSVPNPPPSLVLNEGDILVALGKPEQLQKLKDEVIL